MLHAPLEEPLSDLVPSRPLALITGASSGLGAEFARLLAARKHDLVITARRTDRLTALKGEIEAAHGVRVDLVAADLGAVGGDEALIAAVAALGRPIDVLCNNAGAGVHGLLVDQAPAKVTQMLQLNVMALTRLTQHFAREMVARKRGRVLQVASVGAYQPSPYYAAYSATKAYVLFLSQALHHELKGTGVTCTTLSPGLTDTEFHEVADHKKSGAIALTMMSARKVATIGIAAMMRGREVVTAGFLNQLAAFFVKLLPRRWATASAGSMMRK